MQQIKKISAVFAALVLLTACQPAAQSPSAGGESGTAPAQSQSATSQSPSVSGVYQKLTPEEAKAKMENEDVVIVDVRTAEEYAQGHVPEAILVPNESIGAEKPEQLPDSDAVLLVYCRSGRRSREASEKLLALGYSNVYDFGGIIDWPYDVVTD